MASVFDSSPKGKDNNKTHLASFIDDIVGCLFESDMVQLFFRSLLIRAFCLPVYNSMHMPLHRTTRVTQDDW